MKVYIAAPGQHNWPIIPDDIQDRLLNILIEYFNEEKLLKRSRKKNFSKTSNKTTFSYWFTLCYALFKTKKQCSLVFVCTSLAPIILTKPIYFFHKCIPFHRFVLKIYQQY